ASTGEIKWRDHAPNCSEELARVIDKMVRNDFLQRYKNVNEVLEDILSPPSNLPAEIPEPIPPTAILADKPSASKRLLLFVVLPLSLGLLFLTPKIWRAFQALKFYNEGNALIESGKYKTAVESFDKALNYRNDFPQAWTNRGFAQGKLNRHLEKFSSCVQATDVAPDFAEAWNCRGLARFDLQQYEQALEEYNQAIAADPDFYRGWFNKGQVLLKLDQPREAESATREVLRIKPDYYLAWTQLCRALYDQKRYQDAQAHCKRSMEINPDYPETSALLEKVEKKLQ
ncbi:MAG: tetratricopeptide repeat protein, partial [Hydrococcus sp. SU_1_0]|nr:tetratricopeptide repeat protein [Hydrococcus sp. SU_1_0]